MARETLSGPSRPHANCLTWRRATTGRESEKSAEVTPLSADPPAPPPLLERRYWLAALAVLFVFFAPYQTLVQTVITDDAVRKGLDVDEYDMIWQQVGYVV